MGGGGPIAIKNVVWLNKTFFELLVLQKTIKMIMIRIIWGGGGGLCPPWPPPGHTTVCECNKS